MLDKVLQKLPAAWRPEKPVKQQYISRPQPIYVAIPAYSPESVIDVQPQSAGMERKISEPYNFRRLPTAAEAKDSWC